MYLLSANSLEVMGRVNYDLSETERQLSLWQSRHYDDAIIIDRNPLTLDIKTKFFLDPEQKIQREKYVQRKRLKNANHSGKQNYNF